MKILNFTLVKWLSTICVFILSLFFPIWNITDGLSSSFFNNLDLTRGMILIFVFLVLTSLAVILAFFTYMLVNPKNFGVKKKHKKSKV